jgi:hypothetical protein
VREADHSPLSRAKVKNEWSYYLHSLYTFTTWYLIKHRDNFTYVFTHIMHRYITKQMHSDIQKGCEAIRKFGLLPGVKQLSVKLTLTFT